MLKFEILRVSEHLTEELKMQVMQPPVSGAELASRSSIIQNGRYEALQSALLDNWGMWTLSLEYLMALNEQFLFSRPASLRS